MTKTVICRKPGQWKRHKGMVLPLKMLTRGSLGTQKQQPYLQSCWEPASSTAGWGIWTWRKHSSQDKVDGAGTTSHRPSCCQEGLRRPGQGVPIQRGTGAGIWPRLRTPPFPVPLDVLSHSLRGPGKQQWRKHAHWATSSVRGTCLPSGDTASGVSQSITVLEDGS